MDRYPDIGFDSYDWFFPSQDTMPAGGFGNLIALPLQSRPRENGNSIFLDDDFRPYEDQWAYLSTIGRLSRGELTSIVAEAAATGRIIGVRLPATEEDDEPWAALPSRRNKEPPIEALASISTQQSPSTRRNKSRTWRNTAALTRGGLGWRGRVSLCRLTWIKAAGGIRTTKFS